MVVLLAGDSGAGDLPDRRPDQTTGAIIGA
jgi:hypothetical protein